MGLVRSKTPNGERDRWKTPQAVFDRLNAKYGPFDIDAAADDSNHKCDCWLGPGGPYSDALVVPWGWPGGRVFCNPPYSLTREFVGKAKQEVLEGNIYSATLLVPATTDVAWFHNLVWDEEHDRPQPNVILAFSVGRIRFERPDGTKAGTPTHGSMFVTFRREGQGKLF